MKRVRYGNVVGYANYRIDFQKLATLQTENRSTYKEGNVARTISTITRGCSPGIHFCRLNKIADQCLRMVLRFLGRFYKNAVKEQPTRAKKCFKIYHNTLKLRNKFSVMKLIREVAKCVITS